MIGDTVTVIYRERGGEGRIIDNYATVIKAAAFTIT